MGAVQISGASWTGTLAGQRGPFQDSNGNLWVIADNASTQLTVYKSSDGGASWGTSYSYTTTGQYVRDALYDGSDKIYVVARSQSGTTIGIFSFTISTTTWAEIYSSGTRPTVADDVNTQQPIFLTRRSTGEFVVFYQGPTHSSMGSAYRSVYYARCSSAGVWSAGVEVDAGGQVNFECKSACLGASDRVHMLYAAGPTTNALSHRSLSSANAFSPSSGADTIGPQFTASNSASAYYDSVLGSVVVTHSFIVYRGSSSSTPGWAVDSNDYGLNETTVMSPAFVYEPTDAKLYAFYRDASSDDVYQNSAPDSGTTWGTPAQQDVCTAVNGISVGLITDAIGVVFNDSGVYFDKLVLTAPPTPIPPVTANEEFFALL